MENRLWVRRGKGLRRWRDFVIAKPKMDTGEALRARSAEKYTSTLLLRDRDPSEYVHKVVSLARDAGMDSMEQILLHAWFGLDERFLLHGLATHGGYHY